MSVLWLVYFLSTSVFPSWQSFGLKPRTIEGLFGMFTSIFLHANIDHILGNSITAMALLMLLYSFYSRIGNRVLLFAWILSTFWAWIAARDGNHIGFSGIIYAIAAFIFFSGLFRRYYRMMALSGLIIFLYGSMIWGVFPFDPQVSWESHLFGGIAGIILAWYYRHDGPQRPKYAWEIDDKDDSGLPWKLDENQPKTKPINIRYEYIPKEVKE